MDAIGEETRRIGEIAYNAYSTYSGGVSLISGAVLPVWEELPDNIKEAWGAAASEVRYEVT